MALPLPRFAPYPAKPPTKQDLDAITHRIALRVARYLERVGYLVRDVESDYLDPDAAHYKQKTMIPWPPSLVHAARRRTAVTGWPSVPMLDWASPT